MKIYTRWGIKEDVAAHLTRLILRQARSLPDRVLCWSTKKQKHPTAQIMTQIMFPWRRFKIIEATHWMTVNTKPTAAWNSTDYNFRACQCVSIKLPVNLKPTIENSLKEWKKIKPFVPRFHQAISRDVAVATIRGGHVTQWRCVVNRRSSNTLLSNRQPRQICNC